ncbi:MAG: LamG domain-containing protein [Mediterranea sp.]|nr:LamG domain-containing protein [Mediterranea sp.]
MDPPAGNQVYPKLVRLTTLNFEEAPDPEQIQLSAYTDGEVPAQAVDDSLGNVLHFNGGYARISNPAQTVALQNAISLIFWVKQSESDTEGALFSFENADGTQKLYLTASGTLSFTGPDGASYDNTLANPLFEAGEPKYVGVIVSLTGYSVYVNGELALHVPATPENEATFASMVAFANTAPYIYMGYGSGTPNKEFWMDDFSVWRNTVTAKELAVPTIADEQFVPTIIFGSTNLDTPWWTIHSDLMKASGNCVFHYRFKNFTRGQNNWENWVLVVTNGKAIGEDGVAEYLVMRSDAYGWGTYYTGTMTSDYNWDTFASDMNGATVDLTVKRVGTQFTMTAITTTANGAVYTYTYDVPGFPTGDMGVCLTLEYSYLEIDTQNTYIATAYPQGSNVFGNADNTSGWWSMHSPLQSFDENGAVNYQFYNYGSGAGNWNNWVLVVTNGIAIGGSGVAEYLVMRSDAYGWGTYYATGTMTHNFNFDTFIADMQGAFVDLTVKRIGTRFDMIAKITTTTGTVYDYTWSHPEFPTGPIGFCFTVDSSHMEFTSISTSYPFIKGK